MTITAPIMPPKWCVYVSNNITRSLALGLLLSLLPACQRSTCPSYSTAQTVLDGKSGKPKSTLRKRDKHGRLAKRNRNPFRAR